MIEIVNKYRHLGGLHMKVSTKGRYALRFLINIAARTDNKPVSIKDVAAQ